MRNARAEHACGWVWKDKQPHLVVVGGHNHLNGKDSRKGIQRGLDLITRVPLFGRDDESSVP